MMKKAAGILSLMLFCMLAAFFVIPALADGEITMVFSRTSFTVYLEGQTRVSLDTVFLSEASCRAMNLRKAPVWTLERVSGTSLTLRTENESRILDDGTEIYGCKLILYSVSKAGDTVYDLTCTAGKHTSTRRFTVHAVSRGSSLPEQITFSQTEFTADLNERMVIQPYIVCTPSTAALPAEMTVHCILDRQGTDALNQNDYAVTRDRSILSFKKAGTYPATFTYTLSNLTYSVPVTFHIPDENGNPVVQARGIALNHGNLWLIQGEKANLTASFMPADATNQAVSWETSDPAVATVTSDGKVEATGLGTAVITCSPSDDRCPPSTCFVTVEEWMTVDGFADTHFFYLQGKPQNTLFRLSLTEGTIRRIQEEDLHVEWLLIPQSNSGVELQMYVEPDQYAALVETYDFTSAGIFTCEVVCETETTLWSKRFTVEVDDLGENAPDSVTIATPEVCLEVGESTTVDFSPICTPANAILPENALYTGYGGFYEAIDRSVWKRQGDTATVAFTEAGSYLLLRTWYDRNLSCSAACRFIVGEEQQPALIHASATEAIVYIGGNTSEIATWSIDTGLYEMLNGQVLWGLERISGNTTTAELDMNGSRVSLLIQNPDKQGQDVWQVNCTLQGMTVTEKITVTVLRPENALPTTIAPENAMVAAMPGNPVSVPLRVTCSPAGSALPDSGDDLWDFRMPSGKEDALLDWDVSNGCLQATFRENGDYSCTLAYSSCNLQYTTSLTVHVSSGSGETTALILPAELTRIGEEAFCGSRTAVVDATGSHLDTIGRNAFSNCVFLTDVYLPGSVRSIDGTAFTGCGRIVVHCPKGSYAEQWASGKSQFVISHDMTR